MMKRKRFGCLVLCLLMLFGVLFTTPAKAEEIVLSEEEEVFEDVSLTGESDANEAVLTDPEEEIPKEEEFFSEEEYLSEEESSEEEYLSEEELFEEEILKEETVSDIPAEETEEVIPDAAVTEEASGTLIEEDPEEVSVGEVSSEVVTMEALYAGIPTSLTLSGWAPYYIYTGSPQTAEGLVIKDGETQLLEGRDYTLSYKNNTKASTDKKKMQITVTMKGNYKGKETFFFTIYRKSIGDAGIFKFPADGVVNGKVQKLKPQLYYDSLKLKSGKDYVLRYTAPDLTDKKAYKDAGEWEIEVEGIGNFTGTTTVTEILNAKNTKIPMSKVKVTMSAKSVLYGTTPPFPSLTYQASKDAEPVKLELGKDFYQYRVTPAPTGKVTLIFKAHGDSPYYGETKATYTVLKRKLTKENTELNFPAKVTYQKGGATLPWVGVQYTHGSITQLISDYKVSFSNNKKVTTKAKFKITGTGPYTGTLTGTFEIEKKPISDVWIDVSNVNYSSKNTLKNVRTFVMDTNGKMLKAGTDYTVSIVNPTGVKAVPVGETVTIRISGKGNYEGDKEFEETVIKANGELSKTKAVLTGGPYVYTGEEIKPAFDLDGGKTFGNLVKDTDYIILNPLPGLENTDAGTGTIVVKAAGDWVGFKIITFKINPAE